MVRNSLICVCAALSLVEVRPATAQLAGDLNGDCAVTIDDVVSFVDVLIGVEDDTDLVAAADVDGNSVADARDIEPFVSQLMTMAQCAVCQTLASGFAGGDGSLGDPYQICSAAQLQLAGSHLNANFVLIDDIDLAGVTFTPIGVTTFGDDTVHYDAFFDGAGHRVRNLTIQRPTTDVQGLFGKLGPNAVVQDLGVENVSVFGKLCVGGLAAENNGVVRRCYTTGSVTGSVYVGGMVGDNRTTMSDCHSRASVNGTSSIGGFAGVSFTSPTYLRCYSTGPVSGSNSIGGFIGRLLGTQTVTGCYWDTQTSGQATSVGGSGLTTSQMFLQSSYAGWDFTSTWTPPAGDYPRLQWE
ncbi:MAG TPA: hypothetical protein P5081_23605 [Phycisphaerae bacterium]|nr:hypothetical protein [Phycisphaerae bacterium]HRW55870.1 hypothetical protein [Phycisphaerae bacterium]